jgi:hypothetical protein
MPKSKRCGRNPPQIAARSCAPVSHRISQAAAVTAAMASVERALRQSCEGVIL